MSRVLTYSLQFPAYHPRKGEPTYFREKIWAGLADSVQNFKIPNEITDWDWHQYYNAAPKFHTIRAGSRWKVGDKFSPRVWSGKPYNSKQIIIAPDIEVKKVWDIEMQIDPFLLMEDCIYTLKINDNYIREEKTFSTIQELAKNDGLKPEDFISWFIQSPKVEVFSGQIICWNEKINY